MSDDIRIDGIEGLDEWAGFWDALPDPSEQEIVEPGGGGVGEEECVKGQEPNLLCACLLCRHDRLRKRERARKAKFAQMSQMVNITITVDGFYDGDAKTWDDIVDFRCKVAADKLKREIRKLRRLAERL